MENIESIAQELANVMHSDSRVTLNVRKLQEILYSDYIANGNDMLSIDECREFICGGDDGDGEIDPVLIRLFPNTHEYINSFF